MKKYDKITQKIYPVKMITDEWIKEYGKIIDERKIGNQKLSKKYKEEIMELAIMILLDFEKQCNNNNIKIIIQK